jgi:indolepyruvate ferredoxin oxidoreductase
MGIGVAAAILVRAGHHEGYRVLFADKKGLAIRNGGVYSQVIFLRDGAMACQIIPYGRADLLLGMDVLEAARAIDPKLPFRVAHPEHTAAVLNTDKTPTTTALIAEEDFDVDHLVEMLRQRSRPGAFFAHRLSYLCERLFGTKLYANVTMLGVAYQMGLIPVSLESIKAGILGTIRADFRKNVRAFTLGRKLVAEPELFAERKLPRTLARTVREKATYLNMRRVGRRRALRPERTGPEARLKLPASRVARRYKHLVYTTLRACRELDKQTMRDIAIRVYDLIQWGGYRYALDYAMRVRRVFLADDPRMDFAATRAVVWNLAKLMLIKDEFYVAHLLTSVEKLRRDRQRYRVNVSNGDRIQYRRTFYPRILGRSVAVRVPQWSLYVLRELRFLRHVLPLYHRADRRLLQWYRQVVDRFAYKDEAQYRRCLEVLQSPAQVSGYREYRQPKMAAARQRADHLLAAMQAKPAAAAAAS